MHSSPAQKETRHAETMLPDSAGRDPQRPGEGTEEGTGGSRGWTRSLLGHADPLGGCLPPKTPCLSPQNALPAVGRSLLPTWALPTAPSSLGHAHTGGGLPWKSFKRAHFGCTLEENQILKP